MKNKLFYILFILSSLKTFAQTTITSINWGGITRDRYFLSDKGMNPNPVAPGNGVTWDFTKLTTDKADSMILTDQGGTTPFDFDFPDANVIFSEYYKSTDETLMIHYYKDQFEFSYQGAGLVGGSATPYSTDKKMIKFPMTFNSSFKEFYSVGSTDGYVMVKYDGYGTLKLPSATHSNVFRTTCKDSISASNITYRYEWFTNDRRVMYMTIKGTDTMIRYLDNGNPATGIAKNTIANLNLSIYPNPSATGNFKAQFSGLSNNAYFLITNVFGQVILSRNIDNSSEDFTLLNSGIYFITYYSDKLKVTQKIVVN
ncbi:MAG: T9SS type A sorting domain-containing protein [Bacteroidota bacterium]